MEANLDNSFLFQLLVSPLLRYRLLRHTLLWSLGLFLIYRGFQYIAISIPDPAAQVVYANLSTLFFGGLTVSMYGVVTWLTRRYILQRFQLSRFMASLMLIHGLTALLVRWHFLWFTRYLTLSKLPRMYSVYADHVAQLSIWEVPFDPIIVGLFSFSLFYNYLLYAVGFKVFKDLFSLKIRQVALEKENIQLEYNFLKAQINPHFLFNTLNNIYSFSITTPEKVADIILKLADLMRYSLYETEAELVELSREIAFLESYVQLQRIRHEEQARLTFTVTGNPDGLLVPPLILIVFVENAFKHGPQSSTQPGWVAIELLIDNRKLSLRTVNNVSGKPGQSAGGIGLKNVRKRLEYFFPDRHQLTIGQQGGEFRVDLMINLHE